MCLGCGECHSDRLSSVLRVRLAGRWKSRAAVRRSLPNVFFSRGDVAPRSPYKNTSVLTGEKYKKQVFCRNLVDSIVKFLQILKGETKTTGIIFVCICPFLPRMADNYLWSSYMILKCACFSHWTYLLPTALLKCWNLFCSWVCSAGCSMRFRH